MTYITIIEKCTEIHCLWNRRKNSF